MKNRISTILLLVFLSVTTALGQGPNKLTFSATEVFDPFGILGPPVGTYLPSNATVACPGHEPTGNPLQPCPAGSRTHLRNYMWRSRVSSSTPGVSSGWLTVVSNANLDGEFTGPQWGTFSMAYDSGGTLEGTWQAVRVKVGDHWESPLHANGGISGGAFDGGRVRLTDQIVSFTPIPIAYIGTIDGRIVVPN